MASRLSIVHELIRTTPDDEIAAARASLHNVAERVLSTELYARTGLIGLRPTVDGFGQPEMLTHGVRRRVRVAANLLMVQHDTGETRHELTTLGAAAEAVGIELGGELPYEAFSSTAAETTVAVNGDVAVALAASLDFTGSALERARHAVWHENPSIAQLWPEHFDLAVQVRDVMIGGSLGDAERHGARRTPYLYVAPAEVPEPDEFWNEPYGAAIGFEELRSPDHAFAFFATGLRSLGLL